MQSPAEPETAPPETLIRPPTGWQPINWAELWRFRELILILAWRDIKVRYKQTVLGAAWAVLQPAMMMVVFSVFFGRLAGLDENREVPYRVFVYAGLLPWLFVSSALTNAANSVVGAERVITKIYFPRLALPLSAVATALIDFCFAFGLLVVLMIGYGLWPGLAGLLRAVFLIPLLLGALTLAALGLGILFAGLHVAYRDFRYVTPFLVQVWMFLTPAIYLPADRIDSDNPSIRLLLLLNPLNALITAFRETCLGKPIDWGGVGVALALVAGVFLVGCLYFRRVEDWFADII